MSQHTSAHSTDLHAEHTPTHVPLPPSAAASTTDRDTSFPAVPAAPASPLRVVVADDNPVVRAGLTVLLQNREDIRVVAEAADGRQAYEVAREHRPDVVLLDVRMPGVDGISALPHLAQLAPVVMLTYSRESEVVHEALRLGAGGYLVHGEFTADELVSAVRDVTRGQAHFTTSANNALVARIRAAEQGPPGSPLPEGIGTSLTSTGHRPATPPQSHASAQGNVSTQGADRPADQYRPAEPTVSNPSQLPQNTSLPQPVMGQSSSERARYGLSEREVEVMELIACGMSNSQIAATCFISEKTVKNHINRIFTKLYAATRSEAIAVWLGTARGHGAGGAGRGAAGHG